VKGHPCHRSSSRCAVREETVELDDDDLLGQLREVVDATPDLTMTEAVRQGIKHVVDTGRSGAKG
jgi:hypothetical protein